MSRLQDLEIDDLLNEFENSDIDDDIKHLVDTPQGKLRPKLLARKSEKTLGDDEFKEILEELDVTTPVKPAGLAKLRYANDSLEFSRGSSPESVTEEDHNSCASKDCEQAVRKSDVCEKAPEKCSLLRIGAGPLGSGTFYNEMCCSHLRCNNCDFEVLMFDDCVWEKDVNYLFFRNNFPEIPCLKPKLIKTPGARAYACQCSWKAFRREDVSVTVGSDPALKWVCAKH
eukprot:GCRY01002898.1.p1 GENE.GCRY01002898.1~~GCRY01002898.1.p1  ORF type:complete len:228 (+),score=36.59 GCRY01002898.1:249-932(+)